MDTDFEDDEVAGETAASDALVKVIEAECPLLEVDVSSDFPQPTHEEIDETLRAALPRAHD